jgi:hypothetical protein
VKAAPLLNLLGLPPTAQKVTRYLLREGATGPATLAQALDLQLVEVQAALDALATEQRVRISESGEVEVMLGRTRRRTLPARLWPALQAANRFYSQQEIVSLRTAIPILQFTRAKLGEFTDHGPGHVLRVKLYLAELAARIDSPADGF